MSPASPTIIILSQGATIGALLAAISADPTEGEILAIVPPDLQSHVPPIPALNLNQPHANLHLQLIDSAIAALRPKTIIADVASLELISPTLDRHPQLQNAIIITDASGKKKAVNALAAHFKNHEIKAI